jgi:hypothetical protein
MRGSPGCGRRRLLAPVLLAACATVPPSRRRAGALDQRPPVALRVEATRAAPAQRQSAAFELRGAPSGELRLSSPLGTSWRSARWAPGAVS